LPRTSAREQRTGIRYALLDGRIESTSATLRALGRLMGNERETEDLASWYEAELRDAKRRAALAKATPPLRRAQGW
jgi:iron complex transport system substrate-binding protein